ncbi:MAG: hypothetical protein ACTHUY_11435, partial [Flaviflexus sp.]|uniref:hypothetical protein n=1 Tax=Flaviflexus sp. TaxID=1969482 RepID=UPI003F8F29DA
MSKAANEHTEQSNAPGADAGRGVVLYAATTTLNPALQSTQRDVTIGRNRRPAHNPARPLPRQPPPPPTICCHRVTRRRTTQTITSGTPAPVGIKLLQPATQRLTPRQL